MAIVKKKKYKFTDEMVSRDAIISLCFSVPSLIVIAVSIIISIIKGGKTPEAIGYLLLASLIMCITAFIFSIISYKNQDGGVILRRPALFVCFFDIALNIALLFI